jgi:hypothetical protein
MNDYTNSPSAKLVATHCAVCSRPLVDSLSVETGVGPECRKRHGYTTANAAPDWTAVQSCIGRHVDALNLPADWDTDVRRLANILVHRIAVEQDGALALACVDGLRALGFSTLGTRCAERLAKIRLRIEGMEITLKAPYASEILAIPGRRFDREEKVTRITVRRSMEGAKRTVLDALTRAFPGAAVDGPEGLFLLPKPGDSSS